MASGAPAARGQGLGGTCGLEEAAAMTQASAIPSPRAAQAADRTVYFAPSAPLSLPPGPGSSSEDGADVYPASLGTCPSFYTNRELSCSLRCFCHPPRPFFWCVETCWAQAQADACSTDTSRVSHQQPAACWEARGLGTMG